jgi:hypothetical protein
MQESCGALPTNGEPSMTTVPSTPSTIPSAHLRGCFRILLLYDVAEGFDLPRVRQLLGPRIGSSAPPFPRRTPEYVRFAQPPVIESHVPLTLKTGEQVSSWVKYYAFAVVAVEIEVGFSTDWAGLSRQAARWMDATDLEPLAREIVASRLKEIAAAVVRPNPNWLNESYLVINLQEIGAPAAPQPTAAELVAACGPEIAQLIRGESAALAEKSVEEALQASVSYYPTDLVVVGSFAALVYDRTEDAAATTLVLEFAKMQLLEFRYYDDWMSQLLSGIYTMLDRKRNFLLSRWTLPRDAQRVNAIRLDVMDLTERIDNAIKFFSDVYYARVYRLAASRIGVNEYRELVDEKLRTAGELYEFMVTEFNETRSFVLEVIVGILALIDVIYLFKR